MANESVRIDDIAYYSSHTVRSIDDLGWTAPAGYAFNGWNTQANGGGYSYSPGDSITMPDNDIDLYAMWELVDWNIFYNMNGHGTVPSGVMTSYTATSLLEDCFPPYPNNILDSNGDVIYSFLDWSPAYLPVGSSGNVTFSANWLHVDSSYPGFNTVVILDTSGSMKPS
jgi:uncharacterized repeat protein (TIGR02543 family)